MPSHGTIQQQAALLGAAEIRRREAARRRAARARRRRLAEIRKLERATTSFGQSLDNELTHSGYVDLVRNANDGISNVDRLVHRIIPMLQEQAKKYPR
mgnify:CR=1 FL=1